MIPNDNNQALTVRAVYLGERLDLRGFQRERAIALSPMTIQHGETGHVVLFRYGVVVMIGLSEREEEDFIQELQSLVDHAFTPAEDSRLPLWLDPQVEVDRIDSNGEPHISSLTPSRLQLVAEMMAREVVLTLHEKRVTAAFERIDPMVESLRQRGRSSVRGRAVVKQIGEILHVLHRMTGRAEIQEKPELLWDHTELERFYHQFDQELDIRERGRALNRKLELLADTTEIVLNMDQASSTHRVEWYITLLIVFDIGLHIYEKYVQGI